MLLQCTFFSASSAARGIVKSILQNRLKRQKIPHAAYSTPHDSFVKAFLPDPELQRVWPGNEKNFNILKLNRILKLMPRCQTIAGFLYLTRVKDLVGMCLAFDTGD